MNRPLKFYGRRGARGLKDSQKELFESLLPQITFTKDQLDTLKNGPWWLEIGFGGGEHLAAMAKTNPPVHFLGAEVFKNGIGQLLGHLKNENLTNVKIFPDDVRLILGSLDSESFEKVFLLFPDPWPKKRHSPRRFVQQESIQAIHRILKPGGLWHIASDHPIYQEWVEEQFKFPESQKLFALKRKYTEERPDPKDWPITRYEKKALLEGRTPHFWIFERV